MDHRAASRLGADKKPVAAARGRPRPPARRSRAGGPAPRCRHRSARRRRTAHGPPIPRDGTLLGSLFESLITLSARTYAQACEARVGHLRTRGGEHEIDLIIERRDGRIVALEVKLSATVDDADTRHLKWLADRIGPDLLDAAVITTGNEAYRRADGIGVIPAGLLTA